MFPSAVYPDSPSLPVNLDNHLALLVTRVCNVIDVENISDFICSQINVL